MKSSLVSIEKLYNDWSKLLVANPIDTYTKNLLYKPLGDYCKINHNKLSITDDKEYKYIDINSINTKNNNVQNHLNFL